MLRFFRTNQLYASLLLVFYALLLRLPAWWYPMEELELKDSGAGVLGAWFNGWVMGHRGLVLLLPVLLLFITALIVNRLAASHRLSRQTTQFPGLFVIVISSLCPIMLGFQSLFLANIFLLLAITSAFLLYRTEKTAIPSFNAGFWLGIAALFNTNYVFFLLLLIIIGGALNRLSLRLALRFVAGILVVFWVTGVGYYLSGEWSYFVERQRLSFGMPDLTPVTLWNLGGVVLLSGVLGFVLFKQSNNVKLLNIEGRKKVNMLYWWLLLTLGCLLLFPSPDVYTIHLAAIPVGVLLSFSFNRGGKSAGEAGHLLLVLLLTILNVYPLLLGGR